MSFYLTLPSNSSMDFHPENTVATFTTSLPRRLLLSEPYEVALTEIHYPTTMYNVNSKECFIMEKSVIGNVVIRKFHLSKKAYVTIEQLLHFLNHINVNGTQIVKVELLGSRFVHFKAISEASTILFSSQLSRQLGLDPDVGYLNEGHALIPHNIYMGAPTNMYVYSDIVEQQYVGDVMTRLLRVVQLNINGNTCGRQATQIFTLPHYVPVSKSEFQEVEIHIKDDQGRCVPFSSGTSIVVLHFRKQ
jgi:hypothetical protein